jgi:hypothetical protein
MHTEEKEPDGMAEGLTSNATQQSKHFQLGSATVLCGTVNSKAWASFRKLQRVIRKSGSRFCGQTTRTCKKGAFSNGKPASTLPENARRVILNAPRH